ncbi:MAG: class I SAM-dependent methyltransferase [Anaerolineae bacterium]
MQFDEGWAKPKPVDEDDWTRWQADPLQQVDFAVHIHYLQAFLSRGDRVLEVGAGAGRFTRELAQIVDRIVVVDRSPEKLQRNQRNAAVMDYGRAVEAWHEGDMRKLPSALYDGEFDAVVCLGGPLSYANDERGKALDELVRVTRSGGVLVLSARSLFGTLHENLPAILSHDTPALTREIIRTGELGPRQVAPMDQFWHAFRAQEFGEFVASAGTEVMALSASNCLTSTWKDLLLTWRSDEKIWRHLIELEVEASREPGCLDLGAHIIAVARKR